MVLFLYMNWDFYVYCHKQKSTAHMHGAQASALPTVQPNGIYNLFHLFLYKWLLSEGRMVLSHRIILFVNHNNSIHQCIFQRSCSKVTAFKPISSSDGSDMFFNLYRSTLYSFKKLLKISARKFCCLMFSIHLSKM